MNKSIQNTIQYLKANTNNNVTAGAICLFSKVAKDNISYKGAKEYMLHYKINYKANQLIFGAENVNAKIKSFCPLHFEDYNKLFI